MNAKFFANAARQWNKALICAIVTHSPETEREAARRHREASMARARAFKARDRLRAMVARYDADIAAQDYANAL